MTGEGGGQRGRPETEVAGKDNNEGGRGQAVRRPTPARVFFFFFATTHL